MPAACRQQPLQTGPFWCSMWSCRKAVLRTLWVEWDGTWLHWGGWSRGHVSSGRALGPGRAWPSMEELTRLLWAAIFGAATGALGTHRLRHAEENSSPLPSVLSVGFLSLSRNSLHSPRAGGCPGCVPRVEWCQSLAGQGRAILHQESLSRLPPRSARSSLPS